MPAAKKAAKKSAASATINGRLLVDNASKSHVLAVESASGIVLIPVTVRDAASVEANYTEVSE